ncbi:hypothetical protein ACQPZZ_19715 [Microbispora sp. CA-135349]|uniref:hypothetical protein n=1 Tax=Microbispora sp. CA-135349 TaxID=3239953 RepID=UPI003D947D33
MLVTTKSGATTFTDAVEYVTLGSGSGGPVSVATYRIVNRTAASRSPWPAALPLGRPGHGGRAVRGHRR